MEQFRIIELCPNDSKINEFRKKVIVEDMNVDFYELAECKERAQIYKKYYFHPELEEIYKFSNLKWQQTAFDSVYGLEQDGQIVSISGKKIYSGEFVRLGMHYYTLKKFRKSIRSVLWRQNGFVDSGLRNSQHNHFFITVYAHNSKLQAWSEKLKKRKNFGQMSMRNSDIVSCLTKFSPICQMQFNNVPQLLLHHSPGQAVLPHYFYKEIGATI